MYFSGVISIDPTQITTIKKIKPTKMFAKFLDALTFGAKSKKEEHETFTAVTILQQLNMGFRSIKVKNVIRLAMDDYDFYLDEEGEDDDLKKAMFEFEAKVDPIEAELFNSIYLVLEHLDRSLKYVIEISINRKHKVGEYPIKINVNGLLSDLKANPGETADDVKKRMEGIFANQNAYDNYIKAKSAEFNLFIDELEIAIRKFIKVDDIRKIIKSKMIRPKDKVKEMKQLQHQHHADPVYYGYYNMDAYMFYAFIWSGACYSHNIYCHNTYIVDDTGQDIMSVGDEGFYAGETNTLNDEAVFEAPTGGDIDYYGDNAYADDLSNAGLFDSSSGAGTDIETDSGGWFESDAGSCGSCSSCSSCGGCGGCD